MWLYSATVLATFTYLACSGDSLNAKNRLKQDENHIATARHRHYNRLPADDKEEIEIPMKIPKLSRAQKIALIIESGQNPFEKKRKRKGKGKRRLRKQRQVSRYPGNAYFLLDDTDGDEPQWNANRYRETDNDNVQQRQQQQGQESDSKFENLGWRADMAATTTLNENKWVIVKEPYHDGNYLETSTSWYWDLTTEVPYREEITPTYQDSTLTYWQKFIDHHQFWRQNVEIETNNVTKTTADTTASSVHKMAPDVTEDFSWGRLFIVTPTPAPKSNQPLALPMKSCPHRFDAVTRAFNGRTYVFARDRVYQLWRHDNLHQKASFHINEMFPDGPRTVTVAYTNSRSGVTVLIEHQTVYRYRWNRKNKVFYLARKSPQTLTKKMQVYPRAGFQWIDGNQVLVEGDNFATYDAYWNVATFSGLTSNYFPQFPRDLIGLTYQNSSLFILYTASNNIQIYDTRKYRVIQEYPIQINEFVGCSND